MRNYFNAPRIIRGFVTGKMKRGKGGKCWKIENSFKKNNWNTLLVITRLNRNVWSPALEELFSSAPSRSMHSLGSLRGDWWVLFYFYARTRARGGVEKIFSISCRCSASSWECRDFCAASVATRTGLKLAVDALFRVRLCQQMLFCNQRWKAQHRSCRYRRERIDWSFL